MPLKERDARSLKYFWENKGDIESFIGYESLKGQLKKEYPLLQQALKTIEMGENQVVLALDKILEDSYEEDDI